MKENKMSRRSFLKAGAFASAAGMLAAAPAAAHAAAPNVDKAAEEENGLLGIFGGKPKYVFLFIGDGMGTAQIQSARFYKGTVENNGAVVEGELSFTQFPEVGSVTTYDSTSFCPDSASTATSIATGPNNHEVAAQAGYNVVTTQAGAAALAAGAGKTLIIAENLADGKAICHTINHKLADLTKVQ